MLNQIPQQNVVDMVFDEIMRHIVSGEWKIGDKIPSENELATQLPSEPEFASPSAEPV